ncbi:hypothetical protein GCM10020256_36880 [Streptomyces thermocoprophilus]
MLAERVLHDQVHQLFDELLVQAERELRVHPLLHHGQPLLVEACGRPLEGGAVGAGVYVQVAPPQGEGLGERGCRGGVVTGLGGGPAGQRQTVEHA